MAAHVTGSCRHSHRQSSLEADTRHGRQLLQLELERDVQKSTPRTTSNLSRLYRVVLGFEIALGAHSGAFHPTGLG